MNYAILKNCRSSLLDLRKYSVFPQAIAGTPAGMTELD